MTTQRMWLLGAVLALVGGCTEYCEGGIVVTEAFARAELHADEIAACVHDGQCAPLCADVFHIDGRVKSCRLMSVQHVDLSVQNAPVEPTLDVKTLRGVNLHVVYVPRVKCTPASDASWSGAGDDDDGGGDYDGGDDGSCDDGSCDEAAAATTAGPRAAMTAAAMTAAATTVAAMTVAAMTVAAMTVAVAT